MDDSGADVVFGVGIDALQEREPETDKLRLHLSRVHRLVGLEDLLRFLTGTEEINQVLDAVNSGKEQLPHNSKYIARLLKRIFLII